MKTYIITEEMFLKIKGYLHNNNNDVTFGDLNLLRKALDIISHQNKEEVDKYKVKAYRIRHIPTGLYYSPGDVHLSKIGKIFNYTPKLKNYKNIKISIHCVKPSPVSIKMLTHFGVDIKSIWDGQHYGRYSEYLNVPETDWEIEEI